MTPGDRSPAVGSPSRSAAAQPDASNVAARAGGWSVRHRRAAILGWFVFVVAAFAVGTAVGQRYLTDVQQGNGQSKQATAIYERAFPFHSGEQVLVQGRGGTRIGDPGLTAAVRELVGRLRSLPTVNDVRSPLLAANRMLRSADGRSLLVTFNVAGDFNQAQTNVRGALAAAAATAP
ncbi:MAG TPA: hypothetical protein VE127_07125, partial [Solirubrobacteraceae bacterium]|nr:hypothetical protein [Solirubrobacteraceae bacterium]